MFGGNGSNEYPPIEFKVSFVLSRRHVRWYITQLLQASDNFYYLCSWTT